MAELSEAGQFWIDNGGVWRTARKEHRCMQRTKNNGGCKGDGKIQPGQRYIDTNELYEPFHPYRMCAQCAQGTEKALAA